ncbi:MAG: thiamine pyrophosphokinase [Deltaproteobacteria bacterium]|nr:MAG: thiamine pyrophosphokinase [Deltaproteobacteria bacterium]
MESHGLKPKIIIGDLDSLDDHIRSGVSPDSIVHVEEQQTNDADKAIRYCLEKGAKSVHLLGAAGKRLDQFLANLEVMHKYSSRLRIILWTETERMEFISGQWQESLEEGTVVSLLPLFGGAKGITTTGLTFPLHGESLEPGGIPCGVSNKVNLSPVKIDVSEGKLLLVVNHHFAE